MTRVLLVCEYPTLNGGEHSLLTVLPLLQSRGFEFQALVPGEGPLAAALARLNIEALPLETFRAGSKVSLDDIRRQIADAIVRSCPQLVHGNSLSTSRLTGPVTAAHGVPSIGHLRDIVGLSRQAIADLNCHSRLLAVSHATREFHIAQGLAAEKTFVVYNGVDLEQFSPGAPTGWLRRELGIPPNAKLIGTIGQLVMRKGHDVLAAAAAQLAAQRTDLHYVIVGERYSDKDEARAYEADLRQAFAAGPLAGHAHFLGVRDDVPRLLAELTLLVHPARQEPLGRVLLEAGAAGVPIVATDVGGTREVFSPGGAILIPPNDAAALAVGIARLADDLALRESMAASTLTRIRATFSAQAAAEALARHYAACSRAL